MYRQDGGRVSRRRKTDCSCFEGDSCGSCVRVERKANGIEAPDDVVTLKVEGGTGGADISHHRIDLLQLALLTTGRVANGEGDSPDGQDGEGDYEEASREGEHDFELVIQVHSN